MLIITLIFVFVLSMLVISGLDAINLSMQSESFSFHSYKLFYRAQMGLKSQEASILDKSFPLSFSSISLNAYVDLVAIDKCGNKRVNITSIASKWHQSFKLQTQEIFARVPVAENCKILPRQQIIWWRENED